jgi:transcriptional regulator with XRE-family HTH domain
LAVIDDDLRREALALAVAARIDLCMAHCAITQAELALRSGVSRVTINQLLQGGRLISLRTLETLAAAMDCDVIVDIQPRTTINSVVI